MPHGWLWVIGNVFLVATLLPVSLVAQSAQAAPKEPAPGPYARIAIMRAIDGHSVDWEAGYIRHLEWHRQAKDTFAWYTALQTLRSLLDGARNLAAGAPHPFIAAAPLLEARLAAYLDTS